MKLSLESDRHIYRIQAYAAEAVIIQNPLQSLPENFPMLEREEQRAHLFSEARSSFIIAPEQLDLAWAPSLVGELLAEHLQLLLHYEPEVILLGTGERIRFPTPEVAAPLVRAGVGMEVMDSGAACRTYNILADEGRRVVAAILLPPPE